MWLGPYKNGKSEHRNRHTQREDYVKRQRMSHEDSCYAATNQGMSGAARSWKGQGRILP